ncbi:GIY-YIG nuclease family protein [uncultured Tolumonas sp.]|uniref:GIY-YIG nuclease family protein n=1 Tax=uncultured Tolumonas sp. TaxID=263765 RepID=UPI00292F06AF|nr:GIY-YIG nuclease family protein [uncultured Tolumonas sp.]
MYILDLKHFERFKESKKVKLLRHKDDKYDLLNMMQEGKFENYQNKQSWDVFGDAEYIISFIADRDRYAKFIGVWQVIDKSKNEETNDYSYTTIECDGYEDLKGRLIINWGEGTRSWAQWLHSKGNKKISEVLPENYVMDFPGFYDFQLTYNELKVMISNPDSNREWFRMLSSTSGVYIILDSLTGQQYVGSAYGKGGIWQRWGFYAKNPTGGNKLINELLLERPDAYKNFKYSILRVLEHSSTKETVIEQENLIKTKLGSRAFGLNVN